MNRQQAPGPSFLGTGWSFPPAFALGGKEVEVVSGVEDVHQALQILMRTRPGERPIHDTFGCGLDDVMFEEIDHDLVGRISTLVSNAILEHEPRVALHGVAVERDEADPGLLWIRVDYTVVATNSRYNMVYPFYVNEAARTIR